MRTMTIMKPEAETRVEEFRRLGRMLAEDWTCQVESKTRTVMAEEAFIMNTVFISFKTFTSCKV